MSSIWIGRVGEAAVMSSLLRQKFDVFIPAFGNASADLIAVCPRRGLLRVEVKSSSFRRSETAGWEVKVSRHTSHHKGDGRGHATFKASESDILAIHLPSPNVVLFLPSAPLQGRSSVSVFDDPELYDVPDLTIGCKCD